MPLSRASTIDERLWNRLDTIAPNGCWLWTGHRTKTGCGPLPWKGYHWGAHRLAYTLVKGPIPPGMDACHTCDVRACCNPDHLFGATQKEHMADMERKGRKAIAHGERTSGATLIERTVAKIRWRSAHERISQRQRAAQYVGTQPAIRSIIKGNTWGQ